MKKRSTKEIKLQAKKALQGHVGTVILGLLAVYGLNTLGTILSTNLFSGTSALDLVLSEVFMLVVSLIVGIISAGLGYMLLNISRGKEFSLGDLGYFFKNQPDRVIVAGFVLALIQLVTAIPYYYVSFTTDPGLTVDSQIQWLSMTLGLLAVSTLLNFLISLPFAMTYFLMADDTELGGIQALKESARLMKGNIWRYVKLNLSFIPLLLLSVFTFYIALFWIMPYMEMSMVAFYGIWMGNWTTDCQEMERLTAAFITGPMILEMDMIQKIMTVTEMTVRMIIIQKHESTDRCKCTRHGKWQL